MRYHWLAYLTRSDISKQAKWLECHLQFREREESRIEVRGATLLLSHLNQIAVKTYSLSLSLSLSLFLSFSHPLYPSLSLSLYFIYFCFASVFPKKLYFCLCLSLICSSLCLNSMFSSHSQNILFFFSLSLPLCVCIYPSLSLSLYLSIFALPVTFLKTFSFVSVYL